MSVLFKLAGAAIFGLTATAVVVAIAVARGLNDFGAFLNGDQE